MFNFITCVLAGTAILLVGWVSLGGWGYTSKEKHRLEKRLGELQESNRKLSSYARDYLKVITALENEVKRTIAPEMLVDELIIGKRMLAEKLGLSLASVDAFTKEEGFPDPLFVHHNVRYWVLSQFRSNTSPSSSDDS